MRRGDGARSSLRALLGLLRGNGGLLAAGIVVSLLGAAASLLLPVVVNRLVKEVGGSGGTSLIPHVLLACAILLAVGLLSALQQYLLYRMGEGIVFNARRKLIRSLLRLPIREFDERRSGDLVSRVSNDTTVIRLALTQGVLASAGGIVTMVGALAALLLLDASLFGLTLGIAAIFAILTTGMSLGVKKASRELQESVGQLTSALSRAIVGIRTIRAGNVTDPEERAIIRTADDARKAGLKVARITALLEPMSLLTMQAAVLMVLGVGGLRVAAGQLAIGDLVSFLMYVFLLIAPLGQIFSALGSLGSSMGAIDRIREITELPSESDDHGVTCTSKGRAGAASVTFRNVTFDYRAAAVNGSSRRGALSDVSFHIDPGQRVALVGPSGAGKTTALSLIVRFYDATSGQILIDGVDIAGLPHELVRDRVAYVEQDSPVLPGTIRENLTLIAPKATDADCWDVLDALELGERIRVSTTRLDTPVGEFGATLSGGERQRLAVGRALLARPRLLLLDESTANLDGRTEMLVRRAIASAADNCTLVIVAHRLATVRDADSIIVLDEGRVSAQGSHDDLMKENPLYRELARNQLLVE
ncbi:ABC transporter ATP-binding protein [Microbispora sp. KK1-11]|uniref:ABC transporter ATP-binding protein n=1 Tax=Microbispora sp. KK1-11 TaxID=2053005 RepID=UPI001159F477|nr:ABC transporter ATP-binding protein [Microbispora sp. KK1-11]TQS30794.1 ABC transporter ATP-binding protein [Microbispora sp. KK1-11]